MWIEYSASQSNDLEGTAYGMYFLELSSYYSYENMDGSGLLLLLYQSFRALLNKNLENELNTQLFKRSKYGMILNENGKKLYLQIKESINVLSKTEDIFNIHKEINLGVHVNMPTKIYNSAISKFYENYQNSCICQVKNGPFYN